MPNFQKHSSHAQHNIDFLSTFHSNKEYRDWLITVCFYICVHIIEAIIDKVGKVKIYGKEFKINDSNQLRAILEKNKDLGIEPPKSSHLARQIIADYNFPDIKVIHYALYNLSKTARYYSYAFGQSNAKCAMKDCLKKIIEWSNREHKTSYNDRGMFA